MIRGTEIAHQVLGCLSLSPRIPLGHLGGTRIQDLPEVRQPLKLFRAVFREFVVLGSSEPSGFYLRGDH